ncbi:MAG: hypothetical protein FJX68_11365 [Alphaproteobacteria bacterium]|nr:hypothetical protein [Alphaproteobacteria bacterium]
MSGRGWPALLAMLVLTVAEGGLGRSAAAQSLVADISDHLVAVTTDFAGTELLLFGAVERPGRVVVVVRGPLQTLVVRRKERVLGVWINRLATTFVDVPAFYAIASSAPLAEVASASELARQEFGLRYLRLNPASGAQSDPDGGFRAALVRVKQREGLYSEGLEQVSFLGERLFRARIPLPANVPTGSYVATVFLLVDGEVVAAQTSPLVVSKLGTGARIARVAEHDAAIYGLFAILLALSAGWLGSIAFRQG